MDKFNSILYGKEQKWILKSGYRMFNFVSGNRVKNIKEGYFKKVIDMRRLVAYLENVQLNQSVSKCFKYYV